MRGLKTLFSAAIALLIISAASVAQAQTCGATGTTSASGSNYDPFNPTGTVINNLDLTLTRNNVAGGGKTQDIAFYLTTTVAGIHVTVNNSADVTVGGGDIVIGPGETAPTPDTGSPPPNTANVSFGGNAPQFDIKHVTFNVTLDANADLPASGSIVLNIVGICRGTGGTTSTSFSIPNAITLTIPVLSALQANYAGTALDFGEIGTVTDGQATTHTTPDGQITVRSSGPYSVALSSPTNGYRLANGADRIGYRINFMGLTASNSLAFVTQSCTRAGVIGGVNLPISATLLQGGATHLPGTYNDTVVVTITPLVSTTTGGRACP